MKETILALAVAATALTLGGCEEVTKYVEVPYDVPYDVPFEVQIDKCTPDNCENLVDCPTLAADPYACGKDLWDCIMATGHSMEAVLMASLESCAERDCQDPRHCLSFVSRAFNDAAFGSWGERGGNIRDLTGISQMATPNVPRLWDGHTRREFTPCLTDAERQAGTDAALAQIALNELAKEQ